MAIPSTGADWATSGLNIYQPARVRKGGLVAALIRDYGGASTDLSPGSSFGSPLAADGNIRTDLLATSAAPNQGFYLVGALSPDGPKMTPSVTTDDTEILQSNEDILSEETKNALEVQLVAYESRAVLDALRFNRPLASLQDDGSSGYVTGEVADADVIERQLLLIRAHKANGLREWTIEGIPRLIRNKLGARSWNKKAVDSLDITLKRLLCEFAVDSDGVPVTQFLWRGGAGWLSAGGAPLLGTVAPTPVTGLKVNLVFTISGKDVSKPTFTATKTTGGTTTSLALVGTPSIVTSNGVTTVTLQGGSLTASTAYTGLITVTGDNGATATAAIPSFTSTAS